MPIANSGTETKTVKEFCKRTGLSERNVLRLLAAGKIPGQRVGRRWLIPTAYLERILGNREG